MHDNPIEFSETVRAEWVDYNGHMNVAFYVLIFDHGTDAFLEHIGMDKNLRESTGSSVFVAESHVTYENEVMEGETVRIVPRIIAYDEKRLHMFLEMLREDGQLAATTELMILHVNLNTRKVGPFPGEVLQNIAAIAKQDADKPRPEQLGRTIGLPPSSNKM